jgi:amino acid efflux transporter
MSGLRQPLTTLRGAALMLNIVVGAGLLALPGLAFREAGSLSLVTWIACATLAAPLAAVFVILGRAYPNAGGIAHFADRAFGRAGYGVSSLLLLGAVLLGLPAIALTGGHYAALLVGAPPGLLAIAFLLGAMLLHLFSSAAVARANAVLAGVTILSVSMLVIAACIWLPAWPPHGLGPRLPVTASDWAVAASPFMMVFFAFTGWEVAAGLAEEFENPRRDFPRAMAASFGLTVVLYLAVAALVVRLGPTSGFETSFAQIAEAVLASNGADATAILACIVIFANLSGAIWAVSRLVFSLSREGFLPASLQRTHGGTPWVAVGATTAALLAGITLNLLDILPLDRMLALAGQNFAVLYAVAALVLLVQGRMRWHRILGACVVLAATLLVGAQERLALYPLASIALGYLLARWGRPWPQSVPTRRPATISPSSRSTSPRQETPR